MHKGYSQQQQETLPIYINLCPYYILHTPIHGFPDQERYKTYIKSQKVVKNTADTYMMKIM